MTKLKIKIGDLVNYFNKSDSTGSMIPVNKEVYIKDHKGNLTPIGACIRKPKDVIVESTFKSVDSEHRVSFRTSKQHAVWNGTSTETVMDTPNIVLANNKEYLKESVMEVDNDYLYDISVPAPHLYQTPDGVIHHNTSYALIMAKAFQDKYEDGVILFYDSEYGSPQAYFEQFGVDTSRVVHTPIMNIEELKFDLISQLDGIEKKDNVMILVDSVGNLASKKEIEDAQNEKSVADMTRAKQMKSLWRMATPYFKKFNIPCVAINHTYMEQALFPKAVVSGGTGGVYSSDTIFIIGKSQEKTGKEITGYNFTINIEKSRFVKEKSKFQVRANWEGGVVKWHGFLEVAMEGGYVDKPSVGYYSRPCIEEDKKVREKATTEKDWWSPILEKTDFKEYLKSKYKISYEMLGQDKDTDDLDTIEDE